MISSSRRTQKISDHIAPLLLRKDENYFLTCKTYSFHADVLPSLKNTL